MLFKVSLDGKEHGTFSTHLGTINSLRDYLHEYHVSNLKMRDDGVIVGLAVRAGTGHTVTCELQCECPTCLAERAKQ